MDPHRIIFAIKKHRYLLICAADLLKKMWCSPLEKIVCWISHMGQTHHGNTMCGSIGTPETARKVIIKPSFQLDLAYQQGRATWKTIMISRFGHIIYIHGGVSTCYESLMSLAVSMRCSAGTSLRPDKRLNQPEATKDGGIYHEHIYI